MSTRERRTAGETKGGALSGGLLALLTVPLRQVLPLYVSELVAALVLTGIAAVYGSFAIAKGGKRAIALQSATCLAFIGAACAAHLLAPLTP